MRPDPYQLANDNFSSINELLLVKGITPELFWGKYEVKRDGTAERRLGLVDCLTVHSGSSTVNINYAPLPVLLALPGITAVEAGYIIEGRSHKPFVAVSDFTHDYPVLLGGEA